MAQHAHPQSGAEGTMTMIPEPTLRVQPLPDAVPRMSSVSPEIQLAMLACAARDAIQSRRGNRYNYEAVGRWLDEDGASDSAPAEGDSSRVTQRGTLQRAVAEYTRQMRNLGHYPEKVLVAVKSAVRDVATPVIRDSTLDALVRDAAQWSIAAYFDTNLEKEVRHVPHEAHCGVMVVPPTDDAESDRQRELRED